MMAKVNDTDKPKKKTGRPTDYTETKAEKICDLVSTTILSIHDICKQNNDLPDECTVFRWMNKNPFFRQRYLEAKELQGILYSDAVMRAIWDCEERNEAIAKTNLILRGAQWHLSHLSPKTFGDRPSEQTSSATSAQVEEIAKAVKELNKKHERDY